MQGIIRTLTAAAILFTLGSCASPEVPYLPSVSFECRLAVWPTFDAPVLYLVQRDSFERTTITEFRYRGAGGYGPKHSGAPIVHAVDSKQWEDFTDAVRKCDPWVMASKQPYMDGCDGTTMILEIRDGKRHHRIQRWEPFGHKSEKEFVELATAVIRLLPDR